MTIYTAFNAIWFSIAFATAWALTRDIRKLMRVVRVGLVVVIIAFPWDYLAMTNRAWAYGAPGHKLFGVPLNDSIFIFSCSIFASSILLSQVISRHLNPDR